MRRLVLCLLLIFLCSSINLVFANPNNQHHKYTVILSDPFIWKNFQKLKNEAKKLKIYNDRGKQYLREKDIKYLDKLSARILNYIESKHKLKIKENNIHIYIAKNEKNSCYEFYNYEKTKYVGLECKQFPVEFSNCNLCNIFLNKIKNLPANHVIETEWWNSRVTALVDTFKLKDGVPVYLGLTIVHTS